jgi:hypothetical protein
MIVEDSERMRPTISQPIHDLIGGIKAEQLCLTSTGEAAVTAGLNSDSRPEIVKRVNEGLDFGFLLLTFLRHTPQKTLPK